MKNNNVEKDNNIEETKMKFVLPIESDDPFA